jgi:hypothetical protein
MMPGLWKEGLEGKGALVAEIINLRQARKFRARIEAEKKADANRARFGRSKAEKEASRSEAERLDRTVEGARLDHDDS